MPAETSDIEILNVLLDELDVRARAQRGGARPDEEWACQRRHTRYPFRAECMVRFLPVGASTVCELPGRTRNLSRSGVAFLVRRVFAIGEAVELEVHAAQRPKTYMAGLVTFCRYAGRAWHEVGVTLKTAQSEPVFSNNPVAAMRVFEWFRAGPHSA